MWYVHSTHGLDIFNCRCNRSEKFLEHACFPTYEHEPHLVIYSNIHRNVNTCAKTYAQRYTHTHAHVLLHVALVLWVLYVVYIISRSTQTHNMWTLPMYTSTDIHSLGQNNLRIRGYEQGSDAEARDGRNTGYRSAGNYYTSYSQRCPRTSSASFEPLGLHQNSGMGPLWVHLFRSQWVFGSSILKHVFQEMGVFFFYLGSLSGVKKKHESVKLRKWYLENTYRSTKNACCLQACVLRTVLLTEGKVHIAKKCVHFSKAGSLSCEGAVFYHLRHARKSGSTSPFSGFGKRQRASNTFENHGCPFRGGTCVVCVLWCCLSLCGVPWSVKCVLMTGFALCLWPTRGGLPCLCYSKKVPAAALLFNGDEFHRGTDHSHCKYTCKYLGFVTNEAVVHGVGAMSQWCASVWIVQRPDVLLEELLRWAFFIKRSPIVKNVVNSLEKEPPLLKAQGNQVPIIKKTKASGPPCMFYFSLWKTGYRTRCQWELEPPSSSSKIKKQWQVCAVGDHMLSESKKRKGGRTTTTNARRTRCKSFSRTRILKSDWIGWVFQDKTEVQCPQKMDCPGLQGISQAEIFRRFEDLG